VQPGLFYTFLTRHHFEEDDRSPARNAPSLLSVEDLALCSTIQSVLLEHFAPLLFQAPPGRHMSCTDAIAAAWLTEVVPSAFPGSSGNTSAAFDLGRPLETLTSLECMDWESRGICKPCAHDKRTEWRVEREAIWARIQAYLASKP
jgi:hypothetical protein